MKLGQNIPSFHANTVPSNMVSVIGSVFMTEIKITYSATTWDGLISCSGLSLMTYISNEVDNISKIIYATILSVVVYNGNWKCTQVVSFQSDLKINPKTLSNRISIIPQHLLLTVLLSFANLSLSVLCFVSHSSFCQIPPWWSLSEVALSMETSENTQGRTMRVTNS